MQYTFTMPSKPPSLFYALAYACRDPTPLVVRLSKEGWATVRRMVASSHEPDFVQPHHVVEAMMGTIVTARSYNFWDVEHLYGLGPGKDRDPWPPPEALVSTPITLTPSPLLDVYRRSARAGLVRVIEHGRFIDRPPTRGRPFDPALRMLQVALHHDRAWGRTAHSMWDDTIMEWVLHDRAQQESWYDVDQNVIAEDLEEGAYDHR